ncbi:MAG: multidrug transporter, partial [Rhodobacteraceae bacterium]|nr:multidrug transporter [Paracoccaceae bacterium]
LNNANVKMFVSGMSAKARGYTDTLLEGFNASFAMPDKLLERSLEADIVLCY